MTPPDPPVVPGWTDLQLAAALVIRSYQLADPGSPERQRLDTVRQLLQPHRPPGEFWEWPPLPLLEHEALRRARARPPE